MNKKALIDALNSLRFGELARLSSRLDEVRGQVRAAGHEEIAVILDRAAERLAAFDVKEFRRGVQHAVSRLGHVKEESSRPLAPRLPSRLRR